MFKQTEPILSKWCNNFTTIATMKNPPNIQAARVIEPGVLELVFSTGETLNVNLTDLPKRNAAYAQLATPAFFAKMERDEWGHGIGWPGGLDLGADRLYELANRSHFNSCLRISDGF